MQPRVARSGRSPAAAFTLIELLVVVAIIAILAALLMPSLRSARDTARSSTCLSNLHQWGQAMSIFSSENDGRYPLYVWRGGVSGWMDELQPYIMPGTARQTGTPPGPSLYRDENLVRNKVGVLCPEGPRISAMVPSGTKIDYRWDFGFRGQTHRHSWEDGLAGLNILGNGAYLLNTAVTYLGTTPTPTATLDEFSTYCLRLERLKFPSETALLADGIFYGSAEFRFNYPANNPLGGHLEFRHHGDNSLNVLYADCHAASIPSASLPGNPTGSGTASKFWYGTTDGKTFATSGD